MQHLSDALLLESYLKAQELDLSSDFISLIEEELRRRQVELATNVEIRENNAVT